VDCKTVASTLEATASRPGFHAVSGLAAGGAREWLIWTSNVTLAPSRPSSPDSAFRALTEENVANLT
jgi:hypothetical protein